MRRKIIWAGITILGVALILAAGCGRRDDPVAVLAVGDTGAVAKFTHEFGPNGPGFLPAAGLGLTLTETPLRTSKTYEPPGYRVSGQGRPYPVLYLLLDFGGNEQTKDVTDEYYFEIGLRRMADSLINAGVIKPMIIATVDLQNAYGGSWYANNSIQGRYMDCLLEFVRYTDTAHNVSVENGRQSRAVSGAGMGGYGALMLAMQNPDLFGSASSINGHLAFSASSASHDFAGVEEWAVKVFEENFVTPLPVGQPTTPAALRPYYQMSPDINRPLRKPFTNLVFSMAAAFSPFNRATATKLDSATWMNGAVAGGREANWKVTLPFDWSGKVWPHAWAKWQVADASRYLTSHPVALANTQVLILAGTSGEFNTLAQNRIFHDAVTATGALTIRYQEYDGYGDYPTSRRRYLERTLRDVLIFHSEQFIDPFSLE